jgi:hypothetical protein
MDEMAGDAGADFRFNALPLAFGAHERPRDGLHPVGHPTE